MPAEAQTPAALEIRWCRDSEEAGRLAALFRANLTPGYISHGELQGRRAAGPGEWAPDISRILQDDFQACSRNPLDPSPGTATTLVGAVSREGKPIGVFLVTFSRRSVVPHCVLDDFVVEAGHRGVGVGSACIDWILGECRKRGIARVFLESGIQNEDAHRLFQRAGFRAISIVMMKELGDNPAHGR